MSDETCAGCHQPFTDTPTYQTIPDYGRYHAGCYPGMPAPSAPPVVEETAPLNWLSPESRAEIVQHSESWLWSARTAVLCYEGALTAAESRLAIAEERAALRHPNDLRAANDRLRANNNALNARALTAESTLAAIRALLGEAESGDIPLWSVARTDDWFARLRALSSDGTP